MVARWRCHCRRCSRWHSSTTASLWGVDAMLSEFFGRARARARIDGTNHTDEHGNDPQQEIASCGVARWVDQGEAMAHIEDRGALGRRTLGHPVEARLLVGGELSGTFGDVQRHGRGRTLKLVREVAASARQVLNDLVRKRHKVDRGHVGNVELVVIGGVHGCSNSGTGTGTLLQCRSTILLRIKSTPGHYLESSAQWRTVRTPSTSPNVGSGWAGRTRTRCTAPRAGPGATRSPVPSRAHEARCRRSADA